MDLCTDAAGQHDMIVVLRWPSADPGETWPIAVDVETVHILGAGLFDASVSCWVAPPLDTAAFLVSKNGVEIAGFDLAAGAAHACIENSGSVWRGHIHHNDFALQRTAQDGIHLGIGSVDCPHWLIEDNTFGEFFDNISRAGIYCSHNMTRSVIRNNYFRVDTDNNQIGVHMQGLCTGNMFILDNFFMVPDNMAGEAITTSATAQGLAAGNIAAQGKANMGNIPWVDGGAFSWAGNYSTGITADLALQMPA